METLGEKKCFLHSTLFHTYIHAYDDSAGQLVKHPLLRSNSEQILT